MIGNMDRGKWFVASASVVLLSLVGVAAAILLRVPPKTASTQILAAKAAAAPAAEIHLSGKIRAQNIVGVAPPLERTIGAVFVDAGQDVFEGQLLARINNEGLETGQQ